MLFLYKMLIFHMKYINSTLKDKFNLNITFKPKPVTELDDLLLLLIQYWAWNAHVFLTEDNWYDFAMLLLFQFYTDSQPAEFIHFSKGKTSEDLLNEAEKNKNKWFLKKWNKHDNNDHNTTDSLKYNNNSNTDDDFKYNNNLLSNSDNNNDTITNNNDLFKKSTDEDINCNNSYSSNRINVTMMEDTHNCQSINIDKIKQSVQLNCNMNEINKFKKAIQKYKALCYKNICLWIIKNLKDKEQDVLAMKVHLQHHKDVDNKPKPFIILKGDHWILS